MWIFFIYIIIFIRTIYFAKYYIYYRYYRYFTIIIIIIITVYCTKFIYSVFWEEWMVRWGKTWNLLEIRYRRKLLAEFSKQREIE